MATNVFSLLPYDIKMYEIACFLTHADALAFNSVLRRDECVYKKLPADFALKHALDILQQEHNNIVKRYQIYQDADDFPRLRRAAKAMFRFCLNPRSEIAFMHQTGVKESLIRFLTPWVDEDSEVWEGASVNRKEKLLGFARAALEWVSQTPFVRHVTLNPVRLTQSIF
jgi:hypothetical protein